MTKKVLITDTDNFCKALVFLIFIINYNRKKFKSNWGHVVDLFRTKLIQSDLNALIESIRLLLGIVNIEPMFLK